MKVVDLKRNTSNFLQKTLYWVWGCLLKVSKVYFFFSRCGFRSHRARICSRNIRGTFPWAIPSIFGKTFPVKDIPIFWNVLVSNQPARFFVTAKIHKFKSLEEINVNHQLKLRPTIDQTGTYIDNASKGIAKYLKPLAKN